MRANGPPPPPVVRRGERARGGARPHELFHVARHTHPTSKRIAIFCTNAPPRRKANAINSFDRVDPARADNDMNRRRRSDAELWRRGNLRPKGATGSAA